MRAILCCMMGLDRETQRRVALFLQTRRQCALLSVPAEIIVTDLNNGNRWCLVTQNENSPTHSEAAVFLVDN